MQTHWNGDKLSGSIATRGIVDQIRDRVEDCTFAVLEIGGTLRVPVTSELQVRVDTLLAQGYRRILLNLARLTDIDAAGIGELMRVYRRTAATGGVLRIANPPRRARQLLEIAGTLRFLDPAVKTA